MKKHFFASFLLLSSLLSVNAQWTRTVSTTTPNSGKFKLYPTIITDTVCIGTSTNIKNSTLTVSGLTTLKDLTTTGTTNFYGKIGIIGQTGSLSVNNLVNTQNNSAIMISNHITEADFGTSIRTIVENAGMNKYALQFFTKNTNETETEKMRISGDGNITIPKGSISVNNLVNTKDNSAIMISNHITEADFGTSIRTFVEDYGMNKYALQFFTKNKGEGEKEKMRISGDGNTTIMGSISVNNLVNTQNNSAIMVAHRITEADYGTSIRTVVENRDMNKYALQFFTQKNGLEKDTEKMRISGDGTVVIGSPGTTITDSKLVVAGKISATEIEVKDIAADFVFDKAYKLNSPQEVEAYINEHQHLPGIAPASETAKGVELAKFNTLLLQKVEELTLYMIAQQKKIDRLEKALGEVKQ